MSIKEILHKATDKPWKRDALTVLLLGLGFMAYQVYKSFPQTQTRDLYLAATPEKVYGQERTKMNQLTLKLGDVMIHQNGYCVPTDTVQYYFSRDLTTYYIADKDFSYLRVQCGFQGTVEQYYTYKQNHELTATVKKRFANLTTTAHKLAVQIRELRDKDDESKK
jgi:hypothetical protein